MNAWPDATTVERFLVRVRRRMLALRLMEGAGVGCVLSAVVVFGGLRPGTPGAFALVASIIAASAIVRAAFGDRWRFGWWRSLAGIAQRLERRTPRGRNLIVTAAEVSGSGRHYVNDAVVARAARLTDDLDPSSLFPARTAGSALLVGLLALAASFMQTGNLPEVVSRTLVRSSGPSVRRIEITVIPPSYSGLPRTTLINPSRVEALATSRIEVRVEATARSVHVETIAGTQELRSSEGMFSGVLTAETDGFVFIEPRDSGGVRGERQLIGLAATPDRPPRVTLTSPGRDLFFSTVPAAIPVVINADDDLAIASVRLRYTAVSGSGERFTFVERDVPVTVSSSSPRSWTARGTWQLGQLGLSPGDLVVYRAVATDKRPGAAPVESESYVLEVVTPGAIAAEGFAADDRRDRYAVSQQMVILKTERLLGRRGSMAQDSIRDEARLLAAEQRQVRAEFVFMMGGELEDLAAETAGTLELNEVAEAEAESDLLAGRLQNQGRVDMMRAIRAMSRASSALTETNLDQALRDERSALDNLMRAFSRSRFILRALTQRERIDLERRLSGSLSLTAGLSGPVVTQALDDRTVALRRLLADVAAMTSGDSAEVRAEQASVSALGLLRADPESDTLRNLAARVEEIVARVRERNVTGLQSRIERILAEASSLIAASMPPAPRDREPLEVAQLEGALRDALRRGNRRP